MRAFVILLVLSAQNVYAQGVGSESSVAVLVTRTNRLKAERAVALADELREVLKAKGVPLLAPRELDRRIASLGLKDPLVCAGARSCLNDLVRSLGLGHAVLLSFSAAGSDVAIAAELVGRSGEREAEWGAVMASGSKVPLGELVSPFADAVLAVLTPAPRPAPAEPEPTPAPVPVAAVPVAAAPVAAVAIEPSRSGGKVLLGVAVGFAVAAIALLAVGLQQYGTLSGRAPLPDGRTGSGLSYPEASSRLTGVNALFISSLVASIVMIGFGVGAGAAW